MAMHTEFVSVNFTRPFCSVYFSFYKTKKMIGFKHFDASTLKTCCNYYFVRLSCLEISLNCGSLKMVLWKMNTIQWTCERLVQLYAFIELNWKIGCSMLFISHRYNFDCLENYIHRYCIQHNFSLSMPHNENIDLASSWMRYNFSFDWNTMPIHISLGNWIIQTKSMVTNHWFVLVTFCLRMKWLGKNARKFSLNNVVASVG